MRNISKPSSTTTITQAIAMKTCPRVPCVHGGRLINNQLSQPYQKTMWEKQCVQQGREIQWEDSEKGCWGAVIWVTPAINSFPANGYPGSQTPLKLIIKVQDTDSQLTPCVWSTFDPCWGHYTETLHFQLQLLKPRLCSHCESDLTQLLHTLFYLICVI